MLFPHSCCLTNFSVLMPFGLSYVRHKEIVSQLSEKMNLTATTDPAQNEIRRKEMLQVINSLGIERISLAKQERLGN